MTVRVEGEAPRKAGDVIYLTPQEDRLHKFDKDGRRIN
jgi:multiple sugar transport system ATP-binding protein